ncbi:Decapping nuclease [Caenorhabditis elegans]|uniref:Decapping nuclease n=1 Tax=Caenorhabditis elegans TaxID=6239 RepID=A5JYX9_CAEEL|nr:Decapping nuclease [Caenorhabditis elegans]CAN86644.3 Decapping nuclease [Caenorhabditis elegans]|eukprot:NP_001123023.1 Enhanced Olfactory Learning [Caenorhabditis elegans]
MAVQVKFEQVGTYFKQHDKKAIPGKLPNRLNDDPDLYGKLKYPLALSLGCKDFKDEGGGDVYESIFDFTRKTANRGTSLKETIDADIFSNRSNLTTIATASKFNREPSEIIALRKNGVIFLYKNEKSYEGKYGGGYNFEKYMTLNEVGHPHNPNEKVSNATCSKVVLRTSFVSRKETIKVYYASEVDAVDKNGNFVEMKSTKSDHGKWLHWNSQKHYFQSFLGNVPTILIGRKDQNDCVYQVDKIKTSEIPKMDVKWKVQNCLAQLFTVLNKIMSKLPDDDQAISVKIADGEISYENAKAEDWNFIHPSFLEYFER